MTGRLTAALLSAILAVTLASGVALAQAPNRLIIQAPVEPPGHDLTATPATATAGVLLSTCRSVW